MHERAPGRKLLKIALIVVCIFGVGRFLGWYASRRAIVQLQKATVERLELLGAHYYYDYQLISEGDDDEHLADRNSDEARPFWLSRYVGSEDWFHDVFYVTFAQFDSIKSDRAVAAGREDIGDEELDSLVELPGLRWLALNGTAISNQGLGRLAHAGKLQRLWLSQTNVTDSGIEQLRECSSLTHLSIEATPTTDQSIRLSCQLPSLRVLSLGSQHITSSGLELLGSPVGAIRELYLDRLPVDDKTLKALGSLTSLRTLSIRQTKVSSEGLMHLKPLRDLKRLRLDGNLLTDAAFDAARFWPEIEELTFSGTGVTDNGLAKLAGCKNVKTLALDGTKCTFSGVVDLLVHEQGRVLEDALSTAFETKLDDSFNVISLDVGKVQFSDSDVAILSSLPSIQWLEIPHAPLTDKGIESLSKINFEALSLLKLDGSELSESGVQSLIQIPTLRNLHIFNCSVSKDVLAMAREEVPSLRIYTNAFQH